MINYNYFNICQAGVIGKNGALLEIYGRTWKSASELLLAMNAAYDLGRADGIEATKKLHDSTNDQHS